MREIFFYTDARLALILLKIFPIAGPITSKAMKTTIETKTRINAYSTRPCPFSSLDNLATSFPAYDSNSISKGSMIDFARQSAVLKGLKGPALD
jgi:hypothetical protein